MKVLNFKKLNTAGTLLLIAGLIFLIFYLRAAIYALANDMITAVPFGI